MRKFKNLLINKEIENNNSLNKRIIVFGIWYNFFYDMFEFGLNATSIKKKWNVELKIFIFDESYKNELIIINTNINDIKNQ